MKIRGHHLWVLRNYFEAFETGKSITSYSGPKVDERIAEILKTLREGPNTEVTITDHLDDICAACPASILYRGTKCSYWIREDLVQFDMEAIKEFGLTLNETYPSKTILERISSANTAQTTPH